MRAVNLLPRETERVRSESLRAPLLVGGGGVVAVTAVAVVLFMSAAGSVSEQQSQLESAEATIAGLPAASQPILAPGVLAQERTDRVAALSAALSTRVPLDGLLRELALVLPEDAWLTGLTAAAPTSTAAAGAPGTAPAPGSTSIPGVTIQGATYSHESVARVLARLAAMPSLDGVRLTSSTRVEPTADTKKTNKKSEPLVIFTIAANIRPAGTT